MSDISPRRVPCRPEHTACGTPPSCQPFTLKDGRFVQEPCEQSLRANVQHAVLSVWLEEIRRLVEARALHAGAL